jgi:serine protein kinase
MEVFKQHLQELKKGQRVFENVFQAVSRMILDRENAFSKVNVNGKTIYDYSIFREDKYHLIGLYDEINSFVSFVKDAAEGGSSKEMAYVLVGEPGNGKTFFVEYLCEKYRQFLSQQPNKKYTFKFTNLKDLNLYGNLNFIESQTFEDPMILLMNLFEKEQVAKKLKAFKFTNKEIDNMYMNYRPLGACSEYILDDLKEYYGDVDQVIKNHIEIKPIRISSTMGTVTGKYSARDKITSSAKDLLGEESIQRLMNLSDTNNPYRIDLRIGALARVGACGIHFSDELFKNKKDLVQVYLGVIQNRTIEIDGFKWPLDTLIIATSNNAEFNRFVGSEEEAPIVDRCRIAYHGHNTNYKLQQELTEYSIGHKKTTVDGNALHIDPNLNYAISNAVVLSRLPESKKLTPLEIRKLAAGEIAGDKGIKTLTELIDDLQEETDVTKRFGQRGIGHRNLGRAIQLLLEKSDTQEGCCMFAHDSFVALKQVVLDYIKDAKLKTKYLNDIATAKILYRENIKTSLFNAFLDDPHAIRSEVKKYVNNIVAISEDDMQSDKMWRYKDQVTGETKAIKIDEKYINNVEERMGLKTKEQKESFRTTIRRIYGRKILTEPDYDFMDNHTLVKAIAEVRLKSDVAGAESLVGALANRTNDENKELYNRILKTMMNKLNYCKVCAERTIEYFCCNDDEA